MSTATIQQIGNDLPGWLAAVQRGDTVAIVDAGRKISIRASSPTLPVISNGSVSYDTEEIEVNLLPMELYSDLNNDGQLTSADSGLTGSPYASGELPGISNDKSREVARKSFQQLVSMCMRGELANLAEIVSVRANQLPPSRGDIMLFLMVRSALSAYDQEHGSSREWLNFVDAANPIYRLLAIEVVKRTRDRNEDISGQFFGELANDYDDTIARAAFKAIETLPAKEAFPLLEKMRSLKGTVSAHDEMIRESLEVLSFRQELDEAKLGP